MSESSQALYLARRLRLYMRAHLSIKRQNRGPHSEGEVAAKSAFLHSSKWGSAQSVRRLRDFVLGSRPTPNSLFISKRYARIARRCRVVGEDGNFAIRMEVVCRTSRSGRFISAKECGWKKIQTTKIAKPLCFFFLFLHAHKIISGGRILGVCHIYDPATFQFFLYHFELRHDFFSGVFFHCEGVSLENKKRWRNGSPKKVSKTRFLRHSIHFQPPSLP